MHESGLTEDLFTHTMQHARASNAQRVTRVRVIIGALSDATPESIRFYFDSLASGTIAEGADLEFDRAPGKAHCAACGHNVMIDELFTTCPECGAYALQVTSGNDVYLESLEVQLEEVACALVYPVKS
ncbi:MAG TPA: hydrogenase maturation nickel metallochaperone HypA [Anaerolineales bacterium]|jgi:hydrogenase nickel incorporation protein HypA/HybF|nr:hydrogenase maturation nickel metallochaperone HypA [Anaerolineales bacterium]